MMEGLNLRVAPATLFLGAGASRAFGFPTTKEFLRVLPERLPPGKTRDLLNYLTGTPEITDIEHVLSVLDQVVELENPLLKYMAHHKIPMYMMTWKDFADTAALLRARIRDELFRLYEFDPDKRGTIQSSYEGLLDDMCGNADCMHVFTTNYDSVVEEGLVNSEKYLVIDGFRRRDSGPAIWDSRILRHPKRIQRRKKHVFLYKLHGSLRWRLDKDSTGIMRVETEEKAAKDSRMFAGNILLYPASKVAPTTEPFGTLFNLFRSNLFASPKCIVIGFSFRDPYLNTVFVDFLRSNSRHAVFAISPNADECLSNLISDLTLSRLELQTGTVNSRFGEIDIAADILKILAIKVLPSRPHPTVVWETKRPASARHGT